VQVLSHLSKELKRAPGALGAKALDLSDPEHPELVMATPLKRDPN